MDIATLIGLIGVVITLIFGMGPTRLLSFFDLNSIFIVVGGSIAALFTAFPLTRIFMTLGVVKNVFFAQKITPGDTIKQLVDFAEQARREGILALEARAQEIEDEFLKKGIQLAVDGTEPELIKDILSTEIAFQELRHEKGAKLFDFAGTIAPAFGMIGTLVGLVLMLGNMSDVESIGPNMAVALITTLYGAIIANGICIPITEKLKGYSAEETMIKELMLEGIMSLQSGDNPRIVEQKLTAFIEPALRSSATKERKGE
ncbi:MAG: motility protein A [Chitinivibrionales bacterium]|nr:motility protein A [Chitinivibrionales bacterium]MBD3358678.1 motility protein A [Chitinivibrionales bacterium]